MNIDEEVIYMYVQGIYITFSKKYQKVELQSKRINYRCGDCGHVEKPKSKNKLKHIL